MYKILQSENRRFTLSFLANWKLLYIPWLNLLNGPPPPPPTHTHTSEVSIFEEWRGWISRAIPRKCSPLAQIRRENKKPGPLILVYFMVGFFQSLLLRTFPSKRINLCSSVEIFFLQYFLSVNDFKESRCSFRKIWISARYDIFKICLGLKLGRILKEKRTYFLTYLYKITFSMIPPWFSE